VRGLPCCSAAQQMEWFLNDRPDLAGQVSHWNVPGAGERRLLSLIRGHRMNAVLRRMLDPDEFLADYGVRSVSRYHKTRPYRYWAKSRELSVDYEPSESRSRLFGGNSNWRGPVWFPGKLFDHRLGKSSTTITETTSRSSVPRAQGGISLSIKWPRSL